MRPEWLWDRNISVEEIQRILKDPQSERFVNIAAILLARNNAPKEIFDQYLDQKVFVQNWARIKRQMRKDSWNDPRIIFWQAVYEKLIGELKARGVPIRPRKDASASDELSLQVAEKIKTVRQELHLTQNELAERIGISQQIISRIENGRNDTRLSTLERVFHFLGEQIVIDSRNFWTANKISDGTKEVAHV
ncbi:MAG: helix-turn-helix domain-containing protein [Candidatus Omnitrophica bacterium]|nr:helix-turn-helix domain-containing protein [Candidatus Omnitrophota bacterium]